MNIDINKNTKVWLNHYEKNVPEKINYESVTVVDFLERSASSFPEKPALNYQGYQINFAQLLALTEKFAAHLQNFGIKKGDRVAIILPNVIPCVVACYATLKIGAVVVMNNPLYTDRELLHQLNDSEAKMVITLDLLANRVIAIRPQTSVKQIIYTSLGDYLPFILKLLFPLVAKRKKLKAAVKPAENVFYWKQLLEQSVVTTDEPDKILLADPALIQYTGGTTGVSKGALLTHYNISAQVQQLGAWFPSFFKGAETMLGALPFFHVFGLTTAMNFAIYMGWNDVLVPKPQPDALLKAIRKFKPTFTPLVPTMYIGILNDPKIEKINMSCIKGCFSGSAPLPLEVVKEFEERTGAIIVEGFGLTETSPVTHINPFSIEGTKTGSIGVPISDTDCRIVDLKDGKKDVLAGETGELLIKGPQVMNEYYNIPSETEKVLTDGWLHTGDIARMDEDGYFYIVDRMKDMINSGGFNVYPREIDELFFEHPKVLEACSIGIKHKTRGEAVKVYVVLKEGQIATEKELLEYCQGKLAKYKLPTKIEFISELPKSNVGKVLRKVLRDMEKKGK
ncbi:MAG: long-chain fatty acid--CoA ligase [Deltaproteobacteria bacterium]|nr:long-chain fatty acid--CoA ligase [Deltaproteobacteria bacterium]